MSKCFRIEFENYLRGQKTDRAHGHSPTLNQKEKLNGRKVRTAVVSRKVSEIPFGIDKKDGSHAHLTR